MGDHTLTKKRKAAAKTARQVENHSTVEGQKGNHAVSHGMPKFHHQPRECSRQPRSGGCTKDQADLSVNRKCQRCPFAT